MRFSDWHKLLFEQPGVRKNDFTRFIWMTKAIKLIDR